MSQYDDYTRDLDAVGIGTKPAVIIERRKSPEAYKYALRAAMTERLAIKRVRLADSTGTHSPALIIAREESRIEAILGLLTNREEYPRDAFQVTLGSLLGYSLADCVDYTASNLSRTCGCELCGGPTAESRQDDLHHARRTQVHA